MDLTGGEILMNWLYDTSQFSTPLREAKSKLHIQKKKKYTQFLAVETKTKIAYEKLKILCE